MKIKVSDCSVGRMGPGRVGEARRGLEEMGEGDERREVETRAGRGVSSESVSALMAITSRDREAVTRALHQVWPGLLGSWG